MQAAQVPSLSPTHWSAADWFTLAGVLVAFAALLTGGIGIVLNYAIKGMFAENTAPLKQEVGTMAAEVSRLTAAFGELKDGAKAATAAIVDLKGDTRELRVSMEFIKQVLGRVSWGGAGR